MTELAFLVDLLLNHRLPKATRDAIASRMKEVEVGLTRPIAPPWIQPGQPQVPHLPFRVTSAPVDPGIAMQSASTQAAMLRHAQIGSVEPATLSQLAQIEAGGISVAPAPQPVQQVAQTAAAAVAMAARQEAIALGISGKPAKGEKQPRKF